MLIGVSARRSLVLALGSSAKGLDLYNFASTAAPRRLEMCLYVARGCVK